MAFFIITKNKKDVNNYISVYDDSTLEKEHVKLKGCFEIDKEYHKDPSMRIVPIALKEYFVNRVKTEIEDVTVNGHNYQTLPGLVNISFNFVEGEALMLLLDLEGIAVSTGSACSAGNSESSHVLHAIGLPKAIVQGGIRFSIGKATTKDEIDYVVDVLKAKDLSRSKGHNRTKNPLY